MVMHNHLLLLVQGHTLFYILVDTGHTYKKMYVKMYV